jgi:hypothetical protein
MYANELAMGHLAGDSLVSGLQRRTNVHLASDDARDVDERLQAGEDEKEFECESAFAVVPMGDAYEKALDEHAQHDCREQR